MPATVDAHSDGSFTSYVIEADTEEEITDAIVRIERAYHPLGYGTHFDPPQRREDSRWISRGSRANSCD